MSEKRKKTINQQLKFTGNITISELVTSIPTGFCGPICINGDLIITNEDILNFDYADMWLFNQLRLYGNLKENITEDIDFSKLSSITLIIQGGLSCEGSVTLNNLSLLIKGETEVHGEIKAKEIRTTEDLYCNSNIEVTDNIIVRGDFESSDSISANYIDVRGDLTCDIVSAMDINVLGNFNIEEAISSYEGVKVENDIHVRGDMECTSLKANNITIGGNLISDTSIDVTGKIVVRGNVSCHTINSKDDITIYGEADFTDRIKASNRVQIGKLKYSTNIISCSQLIVG